MKEFVPAPTFGDQSQNNYQDNRAQRLNNDQFTVRVDRNMGNKNLYARYPQSVCQHTSVWHHNGVSHAGPADPILFALQVLNLR